MSLSDIIKKVAEEQNLPYEVCHRAYMSAWKFIHSKVQENVLSVDTPPEEFDRLRMNINIRGIGKLYITRKDFEIKNKKYLIIQKYKQEKYDKDKQDD